MPFFLNSVRATQSEPSLEPGIKGSVSVLLLARCCELNTEAVFPVQRGRFPPYTGFTESPLRILLWLKIERMIPMNKKTSDNIAVCLSNKIRLYRHIQYLKVLTS